MGDQRKPVETAKAGGERGGNIRAERLAAALRANLKRRKQQARARKTDSAASEGPGDER